MDLSIAHLRNFYYVAVLGSFKAAAEQGHRSQPALSLSIKELEQRLGQPLFERGSRARLTPFGQQCLPLVRDAVAQHERVSEAMQRIARGDEGRLTLASVLTATTLWLADVMPLFVERYPGVQVYLSDDDSINIERLVLTGSVDFGLCSLISDDDRLEFEPLACDVFGLVCRRDHPIASRKHFEWHELSTLPLIGTITHSLLLIHPQAESLRRHRMFVSHMGTLMSMLERGVGVTVLPRFAVVPFLSRLAFVPLREPKVERVTGLLKLRDTTLSPPAEAMRNMLREQVCLLKTEANVSTPNSSVSVKGRGRATR